LDHHDLPREVANDLGIILRNGKFLVSMVNDLLDFSKSETDPLYIQKSRMYPMREIDDALLMVQPSMAHKGISFKVQCDSLIPETIVSDPTRFRQILINLLSNAIKYTDQGTITVRVSCDKRSQGGVFRVIVGDTGVGMCDKTQLNLFKPFVRGEPSDVKRVPGSGLGLALSQSLARRLGGDVKLLSSAPGEGSIFEMTLETGDLHETRFLAGDVLRSLPVDALSVGVDRRTLTGKKLLLVEDDPDLRWLMERILKREGATLEMAENGAEAVTQALRDPYHCILMDIKMPVMDGYRATSLLRARGYRNSIVALTASAGSVDKELCFQAGCDAYLSKPVDAAHLLDVIGKQLGGA
jgi:CheY-like chemotaxis protein